MLNNIILTGNLGADPEIAFSDNGVQRAFFNFAFKCSKGKTGWIRVVCFNKLAEIAEKFLHRGARIGIIGILDAEQWKTDDGHNRTSYSVICNSLEFIKTDGRGFEEGQNKDDIPF